MTRSTRSALNRALAQRRVDRAGELVAIERLALAVLLDHRQLAQLDAPRRS